MIINHWMLYDPPQKMSNKVMPRKNVELISVIFLCFIIYATNKQHESFIDSPKNRTARVTIILLLFRQCYPNTIELQIVCTVHWNRQTYCVIHSARSFSFFLDENYVHVGRFCLKLNLLIIFCVHEYSKFFVDFRMNIFFSIFFIKIIVIEFYFFLLHLERGT